MALYYMDIRNVSKAKQSAVAKAAYVSGDKIYSERDEEYKAYRTREVKPSSFILAPSHAPNWVYDRERLWNEAEKVEKPFNARVQREVLVALPIELSLEQNIELVKEYVQENFVNDGMVADVNLHMDKEENPHAHILLTVRPFNNDGTWWKFKSKKEYIKNENGDFVLDANGNKKSRKIDLTGWNHKEKAIQWRENLADKINEKLKENGLDVQVSHLSYEDQGLHKLPKNRLTREEFYIEKKEKERTEKEGLEYIPVTTYGKLNAEIEAYNQELYEIEKEIATLQLAANTTEKESVGIEDQYKFLLDIEAKSLSSVSSETRKALEFIQARAKTSELNFVKIKAVEKSVKAWDFKLNVKIRELQSEKKMLAAIVDIHKNNGDISVFGFEKATFVTQFNKLVKDYQSREKQVLSEFEKFKVADQYSKEVNKLYYEIYKKQFDHLYPKYSSITKFVTDDNFELMDKYLTLFKADGTLTDSVFEYEINDNLHDKTEHQFRNKVQNTLKEYKRYMPLYFATKNHIQASSNNEEKGYEAYKKLYLLKEEFSYLEGKVQEIKERINESLIEMHGEDSKEIIEKIPDRVKVKMLDDYMKEREVKPLNESLEKHKSDFEMNTPQQESNSVTDLFATLLAQATQHQEKNQYDKENKNKRKKKLYKNEREM